MASFIDIKTAFRDELISGTSVPAENIVLDDQEKASDTPSIVYEVFPAAIDFNTVGNGPDRIQTDTNGTVTDYEYDNFVDARFDVTVIADSESTMLPIYDAVKDTFRPYEEWESPQNLHSDVEWVSVEPSSPNDVREHRGQSLDVTLLYGDTTERWGDDATPTTIDTVNEDTS